MKRRTDRILTTHTGSLPRPPELVELMFAKEDGEQVDAEHLAQQVSAAVRDAVQRQHEIGLDVVSDGEMSKSSYATYVTERLTGFGGQSNLPKLSDLLEFPDVAPAWFSDPGVQKLNKNRPSCDGPVSLRDAEPIKTDIENFRQALSEAPATNAFMTAASPGLISMFLGNTYYPTEEEFLWAVAEAMRPEYEAIIEAGFDLQLDCPDLAMAGHREFAGAPLEQFREYVRLHVEVLNAAVAAIPAERMRLHLCWGNYPGPHHLDVPLEKIIDLVLIARPSALVFEAANPRHEHEWTVFESLKLPEGKLLIPGVIDSMTNYIEHPELVAQRIVRLVRLVGRENVAAGSDCGFGTFVGLSLVPPAIAWAKLGSLVEGARLASNRL
jgi:5-methyltetrahydropteroyltriglutamate--homocysteine methyltransferase